MSDYWKTTGSIHEPMAATNIIKNTDLREVISKQGTIRCNMQLQKTELRFAYQTTNVPEIAYCLKFLDSTFEGGLYYPSFRLSSPKAQNWLSKIIKSAGKNDLEFTIKQIIMDKVEKLQYTENETLDLGNPTLLVEFSFETNKDGSIKKYKDYGIIKKEIILKEGGYFGHQPTAQQPPAQPKQPTNPPEQPKREPNPPEQPETKSNIEEIFDEIG